MSYNAREYVKTSFNTSAFQQAQQRALDVMAIAGTASGATAANDPKYITSYSDALSYFSGGDLLNAIQSAYNQQNTPGGIWIVRVGDTGASIEDELLTQTEEDNQEFSLEYAGLDSIDDAVIRKVPNMLTSEVTEEYIVYLFAATNKEQDKILITTTDYRFNALSNMLVTIEDPSGLTVDNFSATSGTTDDRGTLEITITDWSATDYFSVKCYDPNQTSNALCEIKLTFVDPSGTTPDRAFAWLSEVDEKIYLFPYIAVTTEDAGSDQVWQSGDNWNGGRNNANTTVNSITNSSLAFGGQIDVPTDFPDNTELSGGANIDDTNITVSDYANANGKYYYPNSSTTATFNGFAIADGQSETETEATSSIIGFADSVVINGTYEYDTHTNATWATNDANTAQIMGAGYFTTVHVYENVDANGTSISYAQDLDGGSITLNYALQVGDKISIDYTVSALMTALRSFGKADFRIVCFANQHSKTAIKVLRNFVNTRPEGRSCRGVFAMPKKSDSGGKDISYATVGSSARITLLAHDSDDEVASAVACGMVTSSPWITAQGLSVVGITNDSEFTSAEEKMYNDAKINVIGRGPYSPGTGNYVSRGWTLDPTGERDTNDIQDFIDYLDFTLKAEFNLSKYYRDIRINADGLTLILEKTKSLLRPYQKIGLLGDGTTVDIPQLSILQKPESTWTVEEEGIITTLQLERVVTVYITLTYKRQILNMYFNVNVVPA
jgi:hypothetical protein